MKLFICFNKGMIQMPIHRQIGLLPLVTANVTLLLFYARTLTKENAIIRNLSTYGEE